MPTKIFLTGATGYIGGDVLAELMREHPDWHVSCLVRSKKKGERLLARYPEVSIVYGSNDSTNLIEAEAEKADVVIHTAMSDEDVPSADAISKGLSKSGGCFLHTSGCLGLAGISVCQGRYGTNNSEVFDDWDGIESLVNRPINYPHAKVDHIALSAGLSNPDTVKVAIVAPAVVYGESRSPDKTYAFSLWGPFMKYGQVFKINEGSNSWNYIHVHDLSRLYRLLAEDFLSSSKKATWNSKGYYLAENGHYILKDILQQGAKILYERQIIKTPEVKELDVEEAEKHMPYSRFMLGTDSRGHAIRGRKLLGWVPTEPSYPEILPQTLDTDLFLAGI